MNIKQELEEMQDELVGMQEERDILSYRLTEIAWEIMNKIDEEN